MGAGAAEQVLLFGMIAPHQLKEFAEFAGTPATKGVLLDSRDLTYAGLGLSDRAGTRFTKARWVRAGTPRPSR